MKNKTSLVRAIIVYFLVMISGYLFEIKTLLKDNSLPNWFGFAVFVIALFGFFLVLGEDS